jgi:hypothetical protein
LTVEHQVYRVEGVGVVPNQPSLTLIAQSAVQSALGLLLEQIVEGFPFGIRLLLQDGAVDFEDAFYSGYVHRMHIASFGGILDASVYASSRTSR